MKKLLLILLILPMISYGQFTKKELKRIKKLEIKINNRGLDLTATFVPFDNGKWGRTVESNWEQSLFSAGLDVGSYSSKSTVKDNENREVLLEKSNVFKGRYVFDVSAFQLIKILDLHNNNQLAATVSYKWAGLSHTKTDYYLRDYVIQKIIESNK